jgi:phosphatidylinositol dimannoside acyltransferase
MAIELQKVINSQLGVNLASALGRTMPARFGYRLADSIADRIAAQRNWAIVRAVRANQWVINEERLEKAALDRVVRETFRNMAHSLFGLYHYINDREATRQLIVLNDITRQLIERAKYGARGLLIAGLHISSFDLVLQSLCMQGLKVMVLTIPDPRGGRRMEYEARRRIGMNLVPGSAGALLHAVKYLQEGGMVLTGIDRPVPDPRNHPTFFGQPSALPTHHIYLALKAQVPVMIMVAVQHPDGKYHVMTSDPIEMQPHPNRDLEMLLNAEMVLRAAEGFIRMAPQQWGMSLPVWPEIMETVPG